MKYSKFPSSVIRFAAVFVALLSGPSAIPSEAQEGQPRIRIGVNPNIAFMQPAIIAGEGWASLEGFQFEVVVATGPATQLQAFLSGAIDGMANNVGTLLIGAEKLQSTSGGVPHVITTLSRGSISLLARNAPSGVKANSTAELAQRIQTWSNQVQRPLKLVANPKGSLPDLVPRYFLKHASITPLVLMKNAGDQAQLQQFALAPDSDLVSVFEPLTSLLPTLDPSLTVIADPEVLMPNQPGCVLAVSGNFQKAHPEVVAKLADLVRRANRFIDEHPQKSVAHIDRLLTRGIVPQEILLTSLPHIIRDYPIAEAKRGTFEAYRLMRELGYLEHEVDVDALFQLATQP